MKKKKLYQRKWFIALVVIIMIGFIASLGDSETANNATTPSTTEQTDGSSSVGDTTKEQEDIDTNEDDTDTSDDTINDSIDDTSDSDDTTETSESKPKKEPTTTPNEEAKKEPTIYYASTYKVGSDIPAGEYVVYNSSYMCYFEVSSNSSGELDSILANDNFYYNTIITLEEGQYFTVSGGYAVDINEVESLDTSGEGMFKVGTFLEAGEYKIEVDDDNLIGYGYVEVSSDSSHDLYSITSNDNFEGSKYITVSDGQYLTLSGAHIVQ